MIDYLKKCRMLFWRIKFYLITAGIDLKDKKLHQDLMRWGEICGISGSDEKILAILLATKKEFRNLFLYRNRFRWLFYRWIKIWYPPMETLYLEAKEIGGGLFIQHGFATMVSAETIGENCWINQQVTIGYNGIGRSPIIGSNVMITCGAKVLGPITIGDGAVIGANAVVIHDVEAGAVMGGIPAKRIK